MNNLTDEQKAELKRRIEIETAYLEGKDVEQFGGLVDWFPKTDIWFNWASYNYRIAPPKPERLECWGDVYKYGTVYYSRWDEAIKNVGSGCLRVAVHMMEVEDE